MSNVPKTQAKTIVTSEPFQRRGVTILPPAVPPKASLARIREAVRSAVAKHAELVSD